MQIGTLSYGLAAVAFTVLAVLLLFSWRGRSRGGLLTAAAGVCAIWAGAAAYQVTAGRPPLLIADLLELSRDVLWLAFLLSVLATAAAPQGSSGRSVRRAQFALAVFCTVLIVATVFRASSVSDPFAHPDFVTGILGRLILALAGIVIVHQLYVNAAPEKRWAIKYLCLGVGGLFVYDFYLYSHAMLFRRLDLTIWDARGIANALVVPLLAVAAARNRDWSLDVSVSRSVVFHSAALGSAAVYLLVMAAAGYYIRLSGGHWGPVFQVTFLFGAIVLLLVVSFSGTARAGLKVFLNKHFFSYRYDYREEWLRFTRTLSEGEQGVRLRERSIQAIASLAESPAGALWLRRGNGGFERAAHWNLESLTGTVDGNSAFAKFIEQCEWVIDLDECRVRPERYGGVEVPDFLYHNRRAWLVVPLMSGEQLIGFVVLTHSRGRVVALNWEVSDLLRTAGRQAASYLAHLEAANALMAAKQFDSFNRMSAFIIHDLKNLVSQLSLLLANAERHHQNPAFQQEMLDTIGNSVDKMKRLLTQLKAASAVTEPPRPLSLGDVVSQAVAQQAGLPIVPQIELVGDTPHVIASGERLARVLGHLIRNAIEATPATGRVTVRVTASAGFALVVVTDTGRGMTEEFIRGRLFRPFESTKPDGMGVGMYECKQYVEELGGRIEVESEIAKGSTFRVWLPLVERVATEVVA